MCKPLVEYNGMYSTNTEQIFGFLLIMYKTIGLYIGWSIELATLTFRWSILVISTVRFLKIFSDYLMFE